MPVPIFGRSSIGTLSLMHSFWAEGNGTHTGGQVFSPQSASGGKDKSMYFDAKEFGKRLHDVRTSRGITQEELAVRRGLASKQHVSRMENGERSCSIDLLIELSCILHVSTDYLLMGSEPSKEEVKNDLLSIISELSTIAKKI